MRINMCFVFRFQLIFLRKKRNLLSGNLSAWIPTPSLGILPNYSTTDRPKFTLPCQLESNLLAIVPVPGGRNKEELIVWNSFRQAGTRLPIVFVLGFTDIFFLFPDQSVSSPNLKYFLLVVPVYCFQKNYIYEVKFYCTVSKHVSTIVWVPNN